MTQEQHTAQTLEQVYYMVRQHDIQQAIVLVVIIVAAFVVVAVALALVVGGDG